MTITRPITEVAVGILVREDQQFLLGQRPLGKSYAGYWEFPGGKLEAGESPEEALTRELHEELGIITHQCIPWKNIEHDYPHAYVRLYFYKVTKWAGTPFGREGQSLVWQQLPVTLTPLLPATLPVLEWFHAEANHTLSLAKDKDRL